MLGIMTCIYKKLCVKISYLKRNFAYHSDRQREWCSSFEAIYPHLIQLPCLNEGGSRESRGTGNKIGCCNQWVYFKCKANNLLSHHCSQILKKLDYTTHCYLYMSYKNMTLNYMHLNYSSRLCDVDLCTTYALWKWLGAAHSCFHAEYSVTIQLHLLHHVLFIVFVP